MILENLNDLYYYVKTVEHGGFAPAGRALGLPKSKLSRRVAALEERLGVRLLHRSTRHFSVTEIGRTYYDHCKAMLVEAETAQDAIDSVRASPKGVIRLTCPVTLLHVHIGAFLADFMTRYPEVTVHLEATNRRVDVINEGIDVAIRVRPPPLEDSDLVLKVLSDRHPAMVASPAMVARHGLPATPEALSEWPSLALSNPQSSYVWVLYGPNEHQATVPHHPRFVTTDMIALRRAAVAGVGVVQLPLLAVRRQLDDGSLIHLLPDWAPRRDIIHAVFPSRRGLLPAVRTLIDELALFYQSFEER
ncbi:LysR family transcriptional regulator [Alloalcanivorax xenomutans]|uniref:LysR family transcriptional regulator n=1 Tax=Alloalcanivorax xenomutans TaxID=1094342 RepID=UPI001F1BDD3D|nr:LysR family transcriptional regulator [Alloalcanivorax xenomutans]MCE7525592.1 LysR family transcriptional regulator [Alloalcanivorax xenomutans]